MDAREANSFPTFIDDPTIKDRTIAKNSLAIAFLGKMPIVIGHVLICPNREVVKSEDLTYDEWKDILELKEVVCQKLQIAFQAEGFNFAWNESKEAGQSIAHFHLHVLPRKAGDSGILEYEPRKFLYRPDNMRHVSPTEELNSIASLLRSISPISII